MTTATNELKTLVRWSGRHGLPALLMRRAEKSDSSATLVGRDPVRRADPYPTYEQVREQGELVPGPFGWVTAHHSIAERVLQSEDFGVTFNRERLPRPVRWALQRSSGDEAMGVIDPPSMLAVDPPDHTRFRRLVSRSFTPRATASLEPQVQRTAEMLLDALAKESGTVDLVDHYAALLPVIVIAELLGVPLDRRNDFLIWGAAAAATLDAGLPLRRYRKAEHALVQLHAFLRAHFESVRRDPQDDLVSKLVSLQGEEALTERELHSTVLLLLGAGFETTVNLLGNAVVLLDAHRDQWTDLRTRPEGWDVAVEEVLRFDPPVQMTVRHALVDTELAGRPLPKGSTVQLLIAGANRDPLVFDAPGQFDVSRSNARSHLSFSSGIHYCLGSGLARLQGAVGMRTLTERFPDLAIAGAPLRRDLRTLRGFEHIPVRLNQPAAVLTS